MSEMDSRVCEMALDMEDEYVLCNRNEQKAFLLEEEELCMFRDARRPLRNQREVGEHVASVYLRDPRPPMSPADDLDFLSAEQFAFLNGDLGYVGPQLPDYELDSVLADVMLEDVFMPVALLKQTVNKARSMRWNFRNLPNVRGGRNYRGVRVVPIITLD